jgi:protein-S-isoprenylcysteine O-methyltransferase Ste14
MQHVLLAVMWIVYGVIHSVLAHKKVKEAAETKMGHRFRFYRIFYVLFAFVTLVAILIYQLLIPPILLFQKSIATDIAGILVSVSGLILMLVCIRKYFMSLSGLKSLFFEQHRNELIITGVHRYIRHPLYLGTFIFIWGLLLIFPHLSLLVMNVVITVYTLIGIKFEEEKLVEEYGEDYVEYRKRVGALWVRRTAGAKSRV